MHSCNDCLFFLGSILRSGCCVCEHILILVVFPPKPSFLMHEGYVVWAVKLHVLKQLLNCIMLKYPCVLHHLQLYDIIQVMVFEWYPSCYHTCFSVMWLTIHICCTSYDLFWEAQVFHLYDKILHLIFAVICKLYAFLLPCFFPPLLHCRHF